MAIRAIVLSRLLLSVTVLAGFATVAHAQDDDTSKYPIVLRKVTSELVPAPGLGGGDPGRQGNAPQNVQEHDWLRVEFQYDVNPQVPGSDYLDTVTFKVHIEGRDLHFQGAGPDGVPVCFSGTVTYVNVYKGKNGFGSFYLDPSTVERYSAHQGTNDFLRTFDVQVEASVGGQTICYLNEANRTETDPQNWYSKLKPISNLVYTRSKSPFILIDPNRYPSEKLHSTVEVSE